MDVVGSPHSAHDKTSMLEGLQRAWRESDRVCKCVNGVDCSNAMSSLQDCTGDECQQCNSGRDQPTQERAHLRSFNRRANSSLPYRLMLGANLDMAALPSN